jgi:hypothetical protein
MASAPAPAGPPAPPAASKLSSRFEELADAFDDAYAEEKAAAEGASPAPAAGGQAYLAQLGVLARELDGQGRGRADVAAIRLLRQRLAEWIEDVRSVGSHDAVALAVERLVQRLSAALAAGTQLAAEAIAIAAELSRLASGGAPPSGRAAFWK